MNVGISRIFAWEVAPANFLVVRASLCNCLFTICLPTFITYSEFELYKLLLLIIFLNKLTLMVGSCYEFYHLTVFLITINGIA